MGKQIDLERVKRSRARLDEIQSRRPDLRAMDADELEPILEGQNMTDTDKRKLLYTTKEAAALMGCHEETIRRAVRNEEMHAAKVGRSFKISGHELEKFFQRRGGGVLFGDQQ